VLEPFILRRVKKDVEKDLPAKVMDDVGFKLTLNCTGLALVLVLMVRTILAPLSFTVLLVCS
jgi:hypothetical protein